MAPEVLSAQQYSEKVDVFSFAMCLIELMDHHLPWHGYGGPAEVPFKVTSNRRPTSQLKHGAEHSELTTLVKECWAQEPAQRPSFETIVSRLEALETARIGGAE